MVYRKKGFNKKSLNNLNNKDRLPIKSKRCRKEGCKKPICANTSLCLRHLAERTRLNQKDILDYDMLVKSFKRKGFYSKRISSESLNNTGEICR